MPSISLRELFLEFPIPIISGKPDERLVHGIAFDSREIQPGYLFVATVGEYFNAHHYIPQALARGAVAVVGTEDDVNVNIPYLQVENSRKALAHLSAAFYDFPARKLTVIGVTGTDGKTTTCNFIYKILIANGVSAGMVTTVKAVFGEKIIDTGLHVTTPSALELQGYLAQMVSNGLTHVVLETTSHGLAQHRVDGCEFDIGVVTNITHEHLDEHGSFENYLAAKARLFTSLIQTKAKKFGNPRLAVLNKDDDSYGYLKSVCPADYITYSFHGDGDVFVEEVQLVNLGSKFIANGPGWRVPVQCQLPGNHNVSNCLAAMTAMIHGLGIDPDTASQGILDLRRIPGRMESIDLGQDFKVFVDFAHTPNALINAIQTVRPFTNGKVITIFGSAGLRDQEKRRMMAEISIEHADLTILTAEDPRTEPLDKILCEMAEGAIQKGGMEGGSFWLIQDRGDAIRFGVELASGGDTILVCGKGHEQSMCFGEIEYFWDDRIAVQSALCNYLGKDGPEMPRLPTS